VKDDWEVAGKRPGGGRGGKQVKEKSTGTNGPGVCRPWVNWGNSDKREFEAGHLQTVKMDCKEADVESVTEG